jgi:hypothetical protein
VGVVGDRPADELEGDHAANAAVDHGSAAGIDLPALAEHAVGLEHARSRGEEPPEAVSPTLLLALDQEADTARQRADRRLVCLDAPDPGEQLALVVAGAPGVQAAVADLGFVRRRGPQLERLGGLDVVVLEQDQRPRGGITELADDERRCAFHLHDVDGGTEALEPLRDPGAALAQRLRIGGLRGDAAEVDELLRPAIEVLGDVPVQGRVVTCRGCAHL